MSSPLHIFRCDHHRTVVKIEGEWRHVDANSGEAIMGSTCAAGVYRLPIEEEPQHYVSHLMLDRDNSAEFRELTDEQREYVEDLQRATLSAFGVSYDEEECLAWHEADATIDQAVGWINHGCGPGDYTGSPIKDPDEAWS